MRISDWSSDVCSSDLPTPVTNSSRPPDPTPLGPQPRVAVPFFAHFRFEWRPRAEEPDHGRHHSTSRHDRAGRRIYRLCALQRCADLADRYPRPIGRAYGRELVCSYVEISVVAVSLKKKNKN